MLKKREGYKRLERDGKKRESQCICAYMWLSLCNAISRYIPCEKCSVHPIVTSSRCLPYKIPSCPSRM